MEKILSLKNEFAAVGVRVLNIVKDCYNCMKRFLPLCLTKSRLKNLYFLHNHNNIPAISYFFLIRQEVQNLLPQLERVC